MVSNRTLYIGAIRYWLAASGGASVPGPIGPITIDKALKYYDARFPSMAEGFGSVLQNVAQDDLRKAMLELGKRSGPSYPHRDEFFQAVAKRVGSFKAEFVTNAVAETAKDIGKIVAIGSGLYLLAAGVIVLVIFASEAKAFGKALR